ncbi:branched-chain amino acid transaminase (plasmid) [Nicoliella spurrieriana]|uniref:Branched-chain-amino-acid aminotransferase n=1 Tax=Nicoliella spurrieriana TaxID=2925830 RepID=A0A976RQH0_9LACO|nr:branched-chain amino acid transaminase [Nicoliella spurrieriana]UQS86037.1 branched-chain amino acid transaminase [Nicoliella spurrieriana]
MDNNESYVFDNGEFKLEHEVKVGVRSKALNYGLGVFEGFRAYWNEDEQQLYGFRLKDHFKRLKECTKITNLNFPYSVDQMIDFTKQLLVKNNLKQTTYVRPLVLNDSNDITPNLKDPVVRVIMYVQPMKKRVMKDELTAGFSSWERLNDNMLPPHSKTTGAYMNSALAFLEAGNHGYDEALFLTNNGHVSEGTRENIFMLKHGKLVTPPTSDNILEGITRETVMQLVSNEFEIPVEERSISRTELYGADEVFVSGTAMEVTSLVEVDNRVIADGHEGKLVKSLKELFFSVTTGKNSKYKDYCTPVYNK